jgi:hypothetical protein
MTSETKIASNRRNAKKSTGPKTTRGKSRASANAWRHGWAVVKRNDSTLSLDVERMATAICSQGATAALYHQAVIIAECQIFLHKLRAARVTLQKHSKIGSAPDQPRADSKSFMEALDAVRNLQAKLTEAKCNDPAPAANDKSSDLTDGNGAQGTGEDHHARRAGGDVEAFLHGLTELARLERYERRALSRRNRAIRTFAGISIVTPFLGREAGHRN